MRIFLIICFIFVVVLPAQVQASEADFGSCINPGGELRVEYASGVHGIVGSKSEYHGKDAVYNQNDGKYLQCFCSESGDGIQTNWLVAKDLTQSQIEVKKNEGWVYIPDGSAWGLKDDPYLAYNIVYSCRGDKGGIGGVSSNSGSSSSGSNSSGSVLGAAVSTVTSLAQTGDIVKIYLLFSFSLLFVALGFFIRILQQK